MRNLFWMSVVTWMWISAPGASAVNIILNGTGTAAPGTQAGDAFALAAQRVSALFSDPVNVFIDIGYSTLGPGVLGSTFASAVGYLDVDQLRIELANDATSIADFTADFYQGFGPMAMWQNDYDGSRFFDNDGGYNNVTFYLNQANARALGLIPNSYTGSDASIEFSDSFAWDFNPDDGITAGTYDFVGVAMHEMLHTMGFSSGVNDIDYYTGLGPDPGAFDLQNDSWYKPLDLYRYGQNGQRDLSTGPDTYFSIDGGVTNLGFFSTGYYNGDGGQPSHWRDAQGLGLMDPTLSPGERGTISSRDLLMMDVIGWDLAPELDGGTATMPFAMAVLGLLLAQGRRRRA